jgi:hypothetical protein
VYGIHTERSYGISFALNMFKNLSGEDMALAIVLVLCQIFTRRLTGSLEGGVTVGMKRYF